MKIGIIRMEMNQLAIDFRNMKILHILDMNGLHVISM